MFKLKTTRIHELKCEEFVHILNKEGRNNNGDANDHQIVRNTLSSVHGLLCIDGSLEYTKLIALLVCVSSFGN